MNNPHLVHRALTKLRATLVSVALETGLEPMDVNALALGCVTKSMQAILGKQEAREYLESVIEKTWPKE